jgi:hypothetical protein
LRSALGAPRSVSSFRFPLSAFALAALRVAPNGVL